MIDGHPTLDAFLTVLGRLDAYGGGHDVVTSILQEWTLDPAEFGPLFFAGGARRTRTPIFHGRGIAVAADAWRPGARTPVHDHGDGVCYTVVLSGELIVDDYVIVDRRGDQTVHLAYTGSHTLGRGKIDVRSSCMDLHRIRALDAAAVSLHLTAGSLERMTVYNPISGRFRGTPMARAPFSVVGGIAHPNTGDAPQRMVDDVSLPHT